LTENVIKLFWANWMGGLGMLASSFILSKVRLFCGPLDDSAKKLFFGKKQHHLVLGECLLSAICVGAVCKTVT